MEDAASFHSTITTNHVAPVNRVSSAKMKRKKRAETVEEREAIEVSSDDVGGFIRTSRGSLKTIAVFCQERQEIHSGSGIKRPKMDNGRGRGDTVTQEKSAAKKNDKAGSGNKPVKGTGASFGSLCSPSIYSPLSSLRNVPRNSQMAVRGTPHLKKTDRLPVQLYFCSTRFLRAFH